MEINVSKLYEELGGGGNLNGIQQVLSESLTGKNIDLLEYDEEEKEYCLVDNYNILSVIIWEGNLAFTFGPNEYDLCSIEPTDKIIIND